MVYHGYIHGSGQCSPDGRKCSPGGSTWLCFGGKFENGNIAWIVFGATFFYNFQVSNILFTRI
jgi:hypothetical protein